MRYAVVQDAVVINVVLWDGVTDWAAPESASAIVCGDNVGPGWTYDGDIFADPNAVAPE